jgi:hypothetical protein
MGRPPIGEVAMTAAERQRRRRARVNPAPAFRDKARITKPERDLLAAIATILKEANKALETPGRKEALRNAVGWPLHLLETLVAEWPKASLADRRRLANARNVSLMFAVGECDVTRQASAEAIRREIARQGGPT